MTDNEIKKALECKPKAELVEMCNRLQAENEKLRDYNENLQTANTALSNEILEIKAEAYKEFADRLKEEYKEHYRYDDFRVRCLNIQIDNLLKELVGEDK